QISVNAHASAFTTFAKRSDPLVTLSSPAALFADHTTPCRQALDRMLLHPVGELRRPHQAGLHGDVSEVGCGDDLLAAICRSRKTAEHGDDLDHDKTPSLRQAPASSIAGAADASLTGSAGGKMLS